MLDYLILINIFIGGIAGRALIDKEWKMFWIFTGLALLITVISIFV